MDTLQIFERIDQLIRRLNDKGLPILLAQRLNISERSIYNLIDRIKAMGAPIFYHKRRQSYGFKEAVPFNRN